MADAWIAPRLCCGLGNRLFQVLAAIGEAERRQIEPVLFLPRMCHYEHGEFHLLLKLLPHLRIIETVDDWEEIKENPSGAIVFPSNTRTNRPIVLSGFFQNSLNFPSFSNPLWPCLPPFERQSQKQIKPSFWAIHFRLGDYKILPHHQVPKLSQYYCQMILKLPKHTTFILFSDSSEDLPKIGAEIQDLGYYVQIFESPNALETFQAFSSCAAGSICSNSTFAWWAAYFSYKGNGPGYKAFFPDIWLSGKPPSKLLSTPFTIPITLEDLPASPALKTFSYY